jgi:hypothetical protein
VVASGLTVSHHAASLPSSSAFLKNIPYKCRSIAKGRKFRAEISVTPKFIFKDPWYLLKTRQFARNSSDPELFPKNVLVHYASQNHDSCIFTELPTILRVDARLRSKFHVRKKISFDILRRSLSPSFAHHSSQDSANHSMASAMP